MKWTFSKSAKIISHPDVGFGAWSCPAMSEPVSPHTPIENGEYPFRFTDVEWSEPTDSATDLAAYGVAFIPVNRDNNKGLHGGGTGSTHPLEAHQGWVQTEGCIRVQNSDLYHIILNLGYNDTLFVTD